MIDAWNSDGQGYAGHMATAAVVAAVPILADLDTTTLEGRILLSLSGGLGALIATFGDRPKSYQDAVMRISGGVASCFLFGPWIAERLTIEPNINGLLLVFGLIGVLSWYVIGSVSRGLAAMRDNGGLWRAILIALRQQLPEDKAKISPEEKRKGDAEKP